MRVFRILGCFSALAVFTQGALATVVVDRAPLIGTSATVTLLPSGKYRVALSTSVTSQPTTFTVRGDSGDQLENVTIAANVPQSVLLTIRGQNPGNSLQSVDLIDSTGATATVVLSDILTSGDVGQIRVNAINDANIGGNVTGGLTLFQRSGGGQSTITRTRIEGDLLGNVDVSYGSVLNLDVGRKIGASAALPITMTVRDNIFRLVGGEIHANITANGSTDNLVQHIKATGANGTSGDFTGSLSTKRLTCGDCGAGAARGFEVLRNLDADLTFSHGVFDPIKMYYSLNGDITIGTVGQPATYVSNQVIINASGLDAGTWSGDVSVASGSGFITVAPKLN